MPYSSNDQLPDAVKDNLPEHAQTIWREAFNNAHKQYGTEEASVKVAWSAVKNEYEKNDEGKWVKK